MFIDRHTDRQTAHDGLRSLEQWGENITLRIICMGYSGYRTVYICVFIDGETDRNTQTDGQIATPSERESAS